MFTGIITGVGHITRIDDLGASEAHGKRLHVQCPAGYLDDAGLGDSIAINGACMTVTTLQPNADAPTFTLDISAESLNKTAGLDSLGEVNLEKALRANDRLGGHLVSGHVDGIGQVTLFEPVGESWELRILAPMELGKYLAYKGSITVNGVSLTVNQPTDRKWSLWSTSAITKNYQRVLLFRTPLKTPHCDGWQAVPPSIWRST